MSIKTTFLIASDLPSELDALIKTLNPVEMRVVREAARRDGEPATTQSRL